MACKHTYLNVSEAGGAPDAGHETYFMVVIILAVDGIGDHATRMSCKHSTVAVDRRT